MLKAISRVWRTYTKAEALNGVWTWPVTQWVIAALATAVTVISGLVDGIPFMFIWVGAVITAVAAINGMIRFREWRKNLSPRGLVIASDVEIEIDDRVIDGTPWLNWIKLGIQLANLTDRPINYRVVDIRTVLDGRTQINPANPMITGSVPPQFTAAFVDHGINFNCEIPSLPTLEGIIQGKIEFWWDGGEKHELPFGKRVFVGFNHDYTQFVYRRYELANPEGFKDG